jgi:hypothetical protein
VIHSAWYNLNHPIGNAYKFIEKGTIKIFGTNRCFNLKTFVFEADSGIVVTENQEIIFEESTQANDQPKKSRRNRS